MILLIEDNPGDIALFQLALRDTPWPCVVARNAPEGLAMLARAGHGIGVVVVDLRLPGADGWAVLEVLRRDDRGIAAVVFTSSPDARDRARAMALGFHHYWIKPDGLPALRETVQRIGALAAASGRETAIG